ncbi:MAG TPA: nucleoside triphosphate pyrophosphohydrolase [candidate division Zixibacteria bacterium]|nr:nucleoside triphosphate pyrophosphohydrolase [candidate division Zixibacteria bacterium]
MPTPPDKSLPPFERLVELMKTLRGPGGCPWDAKQTHQSLTPYLIEECYELIDTIERADDEHMREELGDLLVQFVFHGVLAEERGAFAMADAITEVTEKLIKRHPHVFGDRGPVETAGDVRDIWERQKLTEREGKPKRLLDSVPASMPALTRAYRFGEKAGGVGYDWPDTTPILEKIQEELAELKAELSAGDREKQTEEVGDLLFVIASLARKLGIDPENALRGSLSKFHRRFNYIEERVIDSGKSWDQFTLAELDAWWDAAKDRERTSTDTT